VGKDRASGLTTNDRLVLEKVAQSFCSVFSSSDILVYDEVRKRKYHEVGLQD
jgi:hypothetical protein